MRILERTADLPACGRQANQVRATSRAGFASESATRVANREIMVTGVTTMRISTVREFRDRATGLLRLKDPILVTRRGRLAGIFFPCPQTTLPLELKRELFGMLAAVIARQIKRRGLSEEEVLADFDRWRKGRRASRRRR